jgi:hypothetical protein
MHDPRLPPQILDKTVNSVTVETIPASRVSDFYHEKRRASMSVTKVIELSASSSKGIEDAVRHGLEKAGKTVKNIKGAWVNDIKVATDSSGAVREWRVNMRINFEVD